MISWLEWQTNFYGRACGDSRLGPIHISLYYSLIHEAGHQYAVPFYLNKQAVMKKAKICSPVTLYRALRELNEFGFIDYNPSFKRGKTRITIRAQDDKVLAGLTDRPSKV